MNVINTDIDDLYILEPKIYSDERGYFFESYNKKTFKINGINYNFVQDNQSSSEYGVIRGLHYQIEPYAQTKLVRVLSGKILDVAVDLRENSKTYGKHVSVILSNDNNKQFLIPKGFAHGFSVLSEVAVILYKCDNFYCKKAERGIKFDDENLKIDWMIKKGKIIISEKDMILPSYKPKNVL